ncbi:MAG: UvrD-helicase domain-containing protein [Clostridia bacterium]|nr:UvrD-helicase domain-containing protein [Clostridia bacterium]
MNLTPEQQAAITTTGKVIVSASAGSGKTFVMINRLVRLVLGGVSVKNVLVLTFTNKAAAQMRDKLRRALIEKIKESEGKTRDRLKAELDALPLADIGTIHGFCARLVRTRFYLTDADPNFRIISADDAEGRALSARAITEVFEEAYEQGSEEFSELLSVYFRKKKDARLKDAVVGLYQNVRTLGAEGDKVESCREILARVGEEDLFDEACKTVKEDFASRARTVLQKTEELRSIFADKKSALTVLENVAFYANRVVATNLFDLAAEAQTAPTIGRMPHMTKAEGDELRALKELSACAKTIKAIYTDLAGIAPKETEYARAENARRLARSLKTLVLRYEEEYSRLKREAGVLDYDDLESYALLVLKDEGAREELRQKYTYLFVDEYQDVNPVQEAILSAVSGENVFLVGDSKQAIYGFRGSSSAHFEEKETTFSKEEDGHALKLSSNFRSASEVLDAVNRVFEPLINGYTDMRSGGAYPEGSGAVRLHYLEEEEEGIEEARGVYSVLGREGREERDPLGEGVASVVMSELGKRWYDVEAVNEETGEKGAYRYIGYGDIAVLARNNVGDMERIVRTLSRYGIPFVTSSKINICETFEVQLVLDWLNYLDNGQQDVPFVSALLSAVGGFTEEELTKIRLRFPSPNTFYGAAEEYSAKMANALSMKLKDFTRKVNALRTAAQALTAAELINRLLAMGLEAQIAAKEGGMSRLARVRRLIGEAGEDGLHAFLARLSAGGNRIEYAENGGDGAVQVLTMHASKGLEFPVVILASQDVLFHGAEKDELCYTKKFLASLRSFDIENKVVYETLMRRAAGIVQKREELKQQKNLLYVAMTRARCRLHVLVKRGERALSPEFANRFSDLYDLSSLACGTEERGEEKFTPATNAAVLPQECDDISQIVGGFVYPYATDYPVKSSATALLNTHPPVTEEDETQKREYAGAGYSTEEGIAYHAFLENVQFGKPVQEELARMARESLLSPEQLAALDATRLERILAMPALACLAGKRIWRERTFLVRLPSSEFYGMHTNASEDETVFQGAIDLLAETDDGYLIVDYKLSGRSNEGIREHYAPQIKLYKKAVARILGVDENKVKAVILNIARCQEIQM